MAAARRPGGSPREPGFGPSMTPLARPGLLVVGYRWRYEIAFVVIASGAFATVVSWAGLVRTLLGLAGLPLMAGLTATRPAARRWVVARLWCVITPHRVRTCFSQAWINNRSGQIPAVVRTTAKPFGERVAVWCRPGTSFEDIESARDLLAAACWSVDVVPTRSGRFAQLVYLDVIRRPDRLAQSGALTGPASEAGAVHPWPGAEPGALHALSEVDDGRPDAA
jgi:hypothetical protein